MPASSRSEPGPPKPAARSALELVGKRVSWHGVRVGRIEEVLLDGDHAQVIGFVLRCEDGLDRFLPISACKLGDTVELGAPLAISEPRALHYYRSRAVPLERLLRGSAGERSGRDVAPIRDVRLGEAGLVTELVVADDRVRSIPAARARVALPPPAER